MAAKISIPTKPAASGPMKVSSATTTPTASAVIAVAWAFPMFMLVDTRSVPLIVLGQIQQCHGDPALARRCADELQEHLVAIGVAIMWSRSDQRETKRVDRAADRNNDADLTAYNDMFAKLAERDARLAERNKLEGR